MRSRRDSQEVNAGSMADIAFLLLIFFLVTASIETEKGLNRLLPNKNPVPLIEIHQRNLFEISLNLEDELLVEGELVSLNDLRNSVKDFIDNGGIQLGNIAACSYCLGARSTESSDNPDKAIIAINTNRKTSYAAYVAVQNEVVGAYNELRDREALKKFGIRYTTMLESYDSDKMKVQERNQLKEKIELLRNMYPQKIVETQITNQNK
ncbi:ExbD/TolR family protein [Croceivirga thetidis]|uniref:Biopolymer transporter ExbD n=1 Tax=Croceivirga thetidis TaxID=2721623 RepID=A0ABX1GLA5_9FLAO|nr:biopolymer transporter ExbD [Croceivirga thetidis]NKI30683.1 biopolymer transporter ExbD [Croceivirga thetidis]